VLGEQPAHLGAALGLAVQVDVAGQVVLHQVGDGVRADLLLRRFEHFAPPGHPLLQRRVHAAVALGPPLLPFQRRGRVRHGRPLAELDLPHAAVDGRLEAVDPGAQLGARHKAKAGVLGQNREVLTGL
jgi:hypothetical protein